MLKEINRISSNSNSLKKNLYMLKYENSTLKIYISELSNSIPMSIQLLTVFPVNKIDCENSEKIVS